MNTTAPTPATTPIPVQLSEPEFEAFIPTTTLLEHALLAQGFMGVQKATFPRCLRPQDRDFTCANLVEALK